MKRRFALSRFRNRSLAASPSQSMVPASSSAVRSCDGFGPPSGAISVAAPIIGVGSGIFSSCEAILLGLLIVTAGNGKEKSGFQAIGPRTISEDVPKQCRQNVSFRSSEKRRSFSLPADTVNLVDRNSAAPLAGRRWILPSYFESTSRDLLGSRSRVLLCR